MQLSAVYPREFGEMLATVFLWCMQEGGVEEAVRHRYYELFLKKLPTPLESLKVIQQQAGGFDDSDPGWPDAEYDCFLPPDPNLVRAAFKKRKAEGSGPAASQPRQNNSFQFKSQSRLEIGCVF